MRNSLTLSSLLQHLSFHVQPLASAAHLNMCFTGQVLYVLLQHTSIVHFLHY